MPTRNPLAIGSCNGFQSPATPLAQAARLKDFIVPFPKLHVKTSSQRIFWAAWYKQQQPKASGRAVPGWQPLHPLSSPCSWCLLVWCTKGAEGSARVGWGCPQGRISPHVGGNCIISGWPGDGQRCGCRTYTRLNYLTL